MSKHLTPYDVVERMIGRPEVIGRAIGIGDKVPYGWRRAAHGRDAGDIPSARHMRRLLAYAGSRGIPLTERHLIWGAECAEIDALLDAAASASPVRAAE